MKTLWITTGLVIGIGVAATVAATADPAEPDRLVPATAPAAESTTTSDVVLAESTTTVAVSTSTSTTSSDAPATTAPQAIVPFAAPAAPTTTVAEQVTTTTRPWNTPGAACSSPGALSWDSNGQVQLVCTDGTWQPK